MKRCKQQSKSNPAEASAWILLLTSLAVSAPNSAQAVTPPAVYNLGTLGGTFSIGFAINASGQVAGYSYTASDLLHAFLYSDTPGSGGTMADLGTLGSTISTGFAINASGQVAGYSYTASG